MQTKFHLILKINMVTLDLVVMILRDSVLNENVSLNLNVKNLDINLKEILPINDNRILFFQKMANLP